MDLLNPVIQFWALAVLVALAILSQIPHVYWSVMRYSNLNKEKGYAQTQASIFCSIISIGILLFVFIGEVWVALGGAVVEIIINTFYFYINGQDKIKSRIKKYNKEKEEFEESRKGKPGVKPEFVSTVTTEITVQEKIENAMAYFIGALFPVIIFVISHYMKQLTDKL